MKILNKSIKVTALLVGVVIGMVACKDDTDLFAIDDAIAQKTMLGTYVRMVVDSTKLTTTIDEWTLSSGHKGVYKHVSTGQGTNLNEEQSFTWDDVALSDDNLKMLLTAKLENGKSEELIWQDGVIVSKAGEYTTVKNPISIADVLRTLNNDFVGDFKAEAIKYYQKSQKVPYLSWYVEPLKNKDRTHTRFETKEEADAKCKELGEALLENKDTIMWFIKEYPSALNFVELVIFVDTTKNELKRYMKDAPEDTVVITVADIPYSVEQVDEQTKEKYYVVYNIKSKKATKDVMVNVAPNNVEVGEMIFKRDAQNNNTAEFSYQRTTKTDEVFTKPTTDKAVINDSIFTLKNATWTPISYTNTHDFVVMLTGTQTIKVTESVAGVEKVIADETKENVTLKLALSNFTPDKVDAKGKEVKVNVECGGLKYKLQ